MALVDEILEDMQLIRRKANAITSLGHIWKAGKVSYDGVEMVYSAQFKNDLKNAYLTLRSELITLATNLQTVEPPT